MLWKDLGEKDGMTGVEGPPLDADIVGFDGGSVSSMFALARWRFRSTLRVSRNDDGAAFGRDRGERWRFRSTLARLAE